MKRKSKGPKHVNCRVACTPRQSSFQAQRLALAVLSLWVDVKLQSWNILEWIDVKAAAGTAGEVGWRAAEKLVDSTWIGSLATILRPSASDFEAEWL